MGIVSRELLEDVDGGTVALACVDRKHGLSDGDKENILGICVDICSFGTEPARAFNIHWRTPIDPEQRRRIRR
ncbi:hypothetical protein D3C73_1385940 [compost metagenome]